MTSRTPEWERARALLAGVFNAARQSVAGQVLLGRELEALKKSLGFTPGGNRRGSKPQVAVLKSWGDYTKEELGISADTADRCIAAYKVIRHRAGTSLGDDSEEFRVLLAPPDSLNEQDRRRLQKAVAELIRDEDSQRSLLSEFRLLRPIHRLTGGDTSQHRKAKEDQPNTGLPWARPDHRRLS